MLRQLSATGVIKLTVPDQVRNGVHALMRDLGTERHPSNDPFHPNLRNFLGRCFPDGPEDPIEWWSWVMRRAFVTQAVLCSIPEREIIRKDGSRRIGKPRQHVPKVSRTCWATWLYRQLDCLHDALIIAAGTKARDAVKPYAEHHRRNWTHCSAFARSECYQQDAHASWARAVAWFHERA